MSNNIELTPDQVTAVAVIARQTHIAMRVLEQFGQGMNWTAIEQIKKTGDKALVVAANPETGSTQGLAALTNSARMMMSTVWSSMLHDSVIDRLSPVVTELSVVAESLTRRAGKPSGDGNEPTLQVPDVKTVLLVDQERRAATDPGTLSPYERMNHERDLRAIGVGLDADQGITELLEKKAQGQKGGTEKVSKLSVEFVNEATLRAWLYSMGVRGLLPDTPSFFDEYLTSTDQHHHAKREVVDRLIQNWGAVRPQISADSLEIAASALLRSACSTRLDTLQYSAVDAVRSALQDTYRAVESVNQTPKAGNQNQARSLSSDINEIAAMLPRLQDKLVFVESELAYGITRQTVRDLIEAMERVERKADALISDYGDDEDATPEHRPGE